MGGGYGRLLLAVTNVMKNEKYAFLLICLLGLCSCHQTRRWHLLFSGPSAVVTKGFAFLASLLSILPLLLINHLSTHFFQSRNRHLLAYFALTLKANSARNLSSQCVSPTRLISHLSPTCYRACPSSASKASASPSSRRVFFCLFLAHTYACFS